MIYSLVFSLLFSTTLLASQVKVKHFSSAKLHRIYKELKVHNPEHFKIAERIEKFRRGYWDYKKINKRKSDITSLIKDTKSIEVFKPFHQWFKALSSLQNLSSANKVINKCKTVNIEHGTLKANVKNICQILFLGKLGDEINKGKYITNRHIDYLKNNFYKISKKHHLLNKLLIKSSKNTNVYPILKKELKALYVMHPTYKITKRLSRKLAIKHVPKRSQKKEVFSISEAKYKELKKNISQVIGMTDLKIKEQKIIDKAQNLVINFYNKNFDLLPQRDSQERIMKLAEYFTRRRKFKVARSLLTFIDKNTKDFNQEVHFCHLWAYILQKDYTQALVYIRFNKLDKKYKSSDSKLNYWVSHVLNEKNDTRSAQNILDFTIKDSPLSYYAITAAKHINNFSLAKKLTINNHPYQTSLDSPEHNFKINSKKLPKRIKNSFSRLQLFAPLKRSPLLKYELDEIFSSLQEIQNDFPTASLTELKADFSLLAANILHKNNKHLETFRLIYKGINKKYLSFNPQVINMLFPRPFLGEVKKQLDKEIDPLLVLSLMRQESSFNPAANSPVGALGLMQLMPATAKLLNKKRVRKKQLKEPQLNIKLGTQYVEYLMKKYNNNIVFTLAAYNAGESRVTYWREHYFNEKSILEDIENIPFTETRKYVKLIYRNIFLYKFLNAQDHLSDSSTPNKIFDLSMNYPQG